MGVNAAPGGARGAVSPAGPVRTPRASRPGRAAPAARTAIRVAIDRIAIEGRSRADHARAADAFAGALASLADAAPGLDWPAATGVARLDAGTVPARATPEEIGRHLAASLLERLSR